MTYDEYMNIIKLLLNTIEINNENLKQARDNYEASHYEKLIYNAEIALVNVRIECKRIHGKNDIE